MDPERSQKIAKIEKYVLHKLRDAPRRFAYRYGDEARQYVLEVLFTALSAGNSDYLKVLFPNGGHEVGWKLQAAQGAVEGGEYTAAAKGKACGHIYKPGEATYGCQTCGVDDSCTLCFKCFEATDHTGHRVTFHLSPGSIGCCDCGDAEAWKRPVHCAIHTHVRDEDSMEADESHGNVPEDFSDAIHATIGASLDYFLDVISCSPENFKTTKTVDTVKRDEHQSRLAGRYYDNPEDDSDQAQEYCILVWNDEKHTFDAVAKQVARACKIKKAEGWKAANESDSIGRSIVKYSTDLQDLLRIAGIIEQIKLTVTVRSARDTFREEMCSTIIEWLSDISGCSVGNDNQILTRAICLEMLQEWRSGSQIGSASIGSKGIDDHSYKELEKLLLKQQRYRERLQIQPNDDDDEVPDGEESSDRFDSDEEVERMDAGYIQVPVSGLDDTLATRDEPIQPTPITLDTHGSSAEPSTANTGLPEVPQTPVHRRKRTPKPAPYWLQRPRGCTQGKRVPPYAEMKRQLRLDWLILYDLRLWKQTRISLRDLYIHTVVSIPEFKRIIGLRFAGLYTVLSQLYLVADREPERSIIHMSFQMLTTPSIVAEVVDKANFITVLMAIIYTFLTTRQVGYPEDVNSEASLSLETGTITSRRLWSLFQDVKHLCNVDYVKECIRTDVRYLLQFLDIAHLHHGLYPNTRARDQHVEYETETWYAANYVTREINRLSALIASSFHLPGGEIPSTLEAAIMGTASIAMVTAEKGEGKRHDWLPCTFEFEKDSRNNLIPFKIVKYAVDRQPVSFHHQVHYALSWLIEFGRGMPLERLKAILSNASEQAKDRLQNEDALDDRVIAMFDFPLRLQVWTAQVKTGLWVRNGYSLQHQMRSYKQIVSNREFGFNRDIFLLQTALVVNEPSRMLATMVERFALSEWLDGSYSTPETYDEAQILEVAEEFLRLLIVILSERLSLIPEYEDGKLEEKKIQREIAHVLCFKPHTYSDLTSKLPDRLPDSPLFHTVLEEMTIFRMPDGLSDSGTFELKKEYLNIVDPFYAHFTRNQREEAEVNYRRRVAAATGQPQDQIVYRPTFQPINSGIFSDLAAFTRTRIFAQIIYYSLAFFKSHNDKGSPLVSKVEPFMQMALHLCHLAVLEDGGSPESIEENSFITNALRLSKKGSTETIARLIRSLSLSDVYHTCSKKAQLILQEMKDRRPAAFAKFAGFSWDTSESIAAPLSDEAEKKRLAKERQARIMAEMARSQQAFLNTAGFDFDDDYMSDEAQEDQPMEEPKTTWKYPSGTCILCQEEMDDSKLYGQLGFITNSNLFRNTPLEDVDFVQEVLETPESLDRSAEHLRPIGVARKNKTKVQRLTQDCKFEIYERDRVGKGFKADDCTRGAVAVSCSHCMHFSCFEQFYESTRRRHLQQNSRHHPERIEKKEFLCPLCKALGNAFFPIIWRPKEASTIMPKTIFADWITTMVKSGKDVEEEPSADEFLDVDALLDEETKYLTPQLSTKVNSMRKKSYSDNLFKLDSLLKPEFSVVSFTGARATHSRIETIMRQEVAYHGQEVELYKIYRGLRDTLRLNEIESRYAEGENYSDLSHCDSLAEILGYTIASVEIGQRGVECDSNETLLNRLSEQTLSTLRILAQTATSYLAVGSMQTKDRNVTVEQFKQYQRLQKEQLFPNDAGFSDADSVEPLFTQDIFVFLASTSVCLAPSLNIDFHHLLTLCYVAEITKCILVFGINGLFTSDAWIEDERLGVYSDTELEQFREFCNLILPANITLEDAWEHPRQLAAVLTLLSKYALVFLRKSLILLHVRYGFEAPVINFDDDIPELLRLTSLLGTPRISDIFSGCIAKTQEAEALLKLIKRWRRQLASYGDGAFSIKPRVPHPAIFELIQLPQEFGILVDEALKKRCPTTGQQLTEPSICLFCGEFMCMQATCCQEQKGLKWGSLNQHVPRCGGNIGLFLTLKKSSLVFLSAGTRKMSSPPSGSFAPAPYLDQFGEADQGMKRSRPLFLMQKRYNALVRNLWLNHGVQTYIARKLENGIDNGGWESL